jgi:hypothetical protein
MSYVMAYLTTALGFVLRWLQGRESMSVFRHDWRECCRDSDEAHRVLDAMRRECGHGLW